MKLTKKQNELFVACAREVLSFPQVRKMGHYIHHGTTTCLEHSIAVAYYSYMLSKQLGLRCPDKSLIRGALLHDFFLYDWRERSSARRLHGMTHPKTALHNAQLFFKLNEVERDIIVKHMWPLTIKLPRYNVALLVSIIDKYCATAETLYGLAGLSPYSMNKMMNTVVDT